MSFICVTFGYNQFAIFNTDTSSQTLVDNIKAVCLNTIITSLQEKDKAYTKEIENSSTEEENLKKLQKATEAELKVEEEKEAEVKKVREAEKKATITSKKETKGKGKKSPSPKKAKKEKEKEETENLVIVAIKEKLQKIQTDLDNVVNNKTIKASKKAKIAEILPVYKKKYRARTQMKIDLVDPKGEKVNINSKPDLISKDFLADRTVYELNEVLEVEKEKTEKEKEKEKKEKEKKDKEDKKEDKKEEEKVVEKEIKYEPVRYDGYCVRSPEEDAKAGENEKAPQKGKKNTTKKK